MLDKETYDLLPPLFKVAMEALKELHNAPHELSVPSLLAAANMPAQALYDVDTIYSPKAPISLFFGVLSPSGTRKSTILNEVTRGVKDFVADRRYVYEQEQTQYEIDIENYKEQRTKARKANAHPQSAATMETLKDLAKHGITTKASLSQNAITLPIKPEKPYGQTFIVDKATTNGLIEALSDVPFVGLMSADAGEFFNSHSWQDKGRSLEMVSTLSKLYSGESIQKQTGVKENNIVLHNRRFCLNLMLQQELANAFADPEYNAQGFIPRMLITQVLDVDVPLLTVGDEAEKRRDYYRSQLQLFTDRTKEMMNEVLTTQEKKRALLQQTMPDAFISKFELRLDTIKMNDGAKALMVEYANDVNQTMLKDPVFTNQRAFIARVFENAVRIAATLAIFDKQKQITEENALCAIMLMEWFIGQRMKLVIEEAMTVAPIVNNAVKLCKWIKEHHKKYPDREITRTYLAQKGPQWYIKMDNRRRVEVLVESVDREIVEMVEVGTATKPKTVYRAKIDLE